MFSLHISDPSISSSRLTRTSTRTHRFCLFGSPSVSSPVLKLTALSTGASDHVGKCTDTNKPSVCTADELHYVPVSESDWNLALWRYIPPPNAPPRNHPLLLLSGLATNAIGFDLSPESSFARYMSNQGYDTWTLELRGAGLSTQRLQSRKMKLKGTPVVSNNIVPLSEKLSALIDEGRSVERKPFNIANQIRGLSERFLNMIKGQQSNSTTVATIEYFQKQLDLIVKYKWDFDHYLEEDLPAAMEYIRTESKPKDRKLLAVGHSMGGILLYAMLSRHGFSKRDSGLALVVTLGSSLDYASSKSSFKLLLPMADPAQALSVPAIPVGAMLAAAHPLVSRVPYMFPWLNPQFSAQDMMHPELFKKLVLNNFGTVPTKLLAQLATAFKKGGLCDRSETFFYKDHLRESNVPILALAGDQDLICPPEAVYETIKRVPEDLITYKVFGEPGGPHYGHYDLIGGRLATEQVYPCIIKFLSRHDLT